VRRDELRVLGDERAADVPLTVFVAVTINCAEVASPALKVSASNWAAVPTFRREECGPAFAKRLTRGGHEILLSVLF
jgi:hypothetical protein